MTRLPGISSRNPAPARVVGRPAASLELSAAGRTLGPWRLTKLIGRGELMALYRARPTESAAGPGCYLVKAAAAPRSGLAIARAMLRREASVAAAVSHANLVAVLAGSVGEEQPYLLLPYLEGVTLRLLMPFTAAKQLPVTTGLWMARQIGEALTTLHAAGWLHGQVRPEHVIVSPQGHATLIDLCLARRLQTVECDIDQSPLESNASFAPESLAKHGRLEAASDTYCLGLLLFELLAGQPPFASGDPVRLSEMHRREAPPDLRTRRADAPPELAHLLRLMLAKDPLRRPSDDELVRWLTELEIAALA